MLALLAISAFAIPPRGEAMVGGSGNADFLYAFGIFQPSLLRQADASVVLRASVSQIAYTFLDGDTWRRVDTSGASIGPGFVYNAHDLGLSVAVGFGARYSTSRATLIPDRRADVDVSLATEGFWRPGQRAQLYGQVAFTAAARYLWARTGATVSALPPLGRDAAVSVWLGGEVTSSGTFALDPRVLEVGPVLEVPIRDLHLVLSGRGAAAYQDRGAGLARQGWSAGAGLYWTY